MSALGSIYFIQEGEGGAIKIGWTTNDPVRRRDNLQIGNSRDLKLIGVIENVPQWIEFDWHGRFAACRKRSEWFFPTSDLLEAIAGQRGSLLTVPNSGVGESVRADAMAKIVSLFGGVRPMARALSRTASTVQYWKTSQALPRGERDALIRALVAEGQTEAEATELVDRSIAGLSAESEAA